MAMQPSSDLRLAAHLANPFLLPGQSGQPLSLRSLADSGMVVITPDGHKLWFTALEVCRAKKEMNQDTTPKTKAVRGTKVLHEIDPRKSTLTAKPSGKSRDGLSEMIVLPEDLKYLEEQINVDSRNHPKPHSTPGR